MASQDLTTISAPEERRRCEKGHLMAKRCKTYCAACHNKERYHERRALGMNSSQASGKAPDYAKKARYVRYQIRRCEHGVDSYLASGHISLEARENRKRFNREHKRRFRAKWGYPSRNALDNALRGTGKLLGLPDREAVKAWVDEHGWPTLEYIENLKKGKEEDNEQESRNAERDSQSVVRTTSQSTEG